MATGTSPMVLISSDVVSSPPVNPSPWINNKKIHRTGLSGRDDATLYCSTLRQCLLHWFSPTKCISVINDKSVSRMSNVESCCVLLRPAHWARPLLSYWAVTLVYWLKNQAPSKQSGETLTCRMKRNITEHEKIILFASLEHDIILQFVTDMQQLTICYGTLPVVTPATHVKLSVLHSTYAVDNETRSGGMYHLKFIVNF